jgi:NAD(P)-dependent dehydrogenase (short-subunit alcohol dehydrogenase family)
MPKTIVIFGAGTGLGSSVARRFGSEGYQVALVGRRPAPLRALVSELAGIGVDAAAFPADLSDTAAIPDLLATITAHYGRIDVVEYAPITTAPFTPAADLTPEAMQGFINLYLLTPIEIVNRVLPPMLARGFGGILIGQGSSASQPAPFMSGVGPAMAAARNYIHSLHGEVAARGVYAGSLLVNAMIAGSAGHAAMTSGELTLDLPDDFVIPTVDPAELAELLWHQLDRRDRIEVLHPEGDSSAVVSR